MGLMQAMDTTEESAALAARFGGIDRLYGAGSVARLARARVAVVGVGGVGSWAAEALARSGIGPLTLIDADDICVSNTNRQLPALEGQYGQLKVEAMGARLRAINPGLELAPVAGFLTPGNLEALLLRDFDVVLDACDSFRTKVETIVFCRRRKIPLVVVGSAGGCDPTKSRSAICHTEHDDAGADPQEAAPTSISHAKAARFGVKAVIHGNAPPVRGSACGCAAGWPGRRVEAGLWCRLGAAISPEPLLSLPWAGDGDAAAGVRPGVFPGWRIDRGRARSHKSGRILKKNGSHRSGEPASPDAIGRSV